MLNFGCANDIREGWVNVDVQRGKGIISFDFNVLPYPFEDNTFELIHAENILEHLGRPKEVLHELRRISKNNGIIEIIVPYYNNKGAFNDMEHIHYFSDNTFVDFVSGVNWVDKSIRFEIIESKLMPTNIGRFIPFRKKLSLFIGGLIAQVNVKLKVVK